jgi:hypothetical protein
LLVYSSFVFAGPAVVSALIQTALYPSYLVAFEQEFVFTSLVMAAVFWSVGSTYKGAIAIFDVGVARARLWFIVLPILFYVVIMGLGGALFAAAA